jgi:ABC-2 type transport system ATP-binding protein
MNKKTPVVKVKNLNKSYGKHKVLDDVSFEIFKGEVVGFIGPNGAGKSTTMKCLCNLIFPDSGDISICGFDLFDEREKALSEQAALIEAPGLYLDMTGKQNIDFIGKIRKITKVRIKEIYEFTELNQALDRKVSGYSMGMKQRLALGIAIMSRPKFVILDEPTNGLDPTGIIHLRNTLQNLMEKEDMSIMFSSHQLGEVEKLADRIICINNGKIIETPKALDNKNRYIMQFENNEAPYGFLKASPLSEKVSKLGYDSIAIEFKNLSDFGDTLSKLITEGHHVKDVYKDMIDIEAVYKEVYGDHHE